MIIETNPCESCECSPAFCDGDIEICQLTRGNSSPISEESFELEQSEEYKKQYMDSCKSEIN